MADKLFLHTCRIRQVLRRCWQAPPPPNC